MSTPIEAFSVPFDMDEVISRLREVTPDVVFSRKVAHSAKFVCKPEHSALSTSDISKHRSHIQSDSYWQTEALHLKKALADVVFAALTAECSTSTTTDAVDWHKMVLLYRRRLARQGVDADDVERRRRSIEDEGYWEHEATCLKRFSALEEEALRAAYLKRSRKAETPTTPPAYKRQTQRRTRAREHKTFKKQR